MQTVSTGAAAVIAAHPSNPTAAETFAKANADAMLNFAAVSAKLPAAFAQVIAQAKASANAKAASDTATAN